MKAKGNNEEMKERDDVRTPEVIPKCAPRYGVQVYSNSSNRVRKNTLQIIKWSKKESAIFLIVHST